MSHQQVMLKSAQEHAHIVEKYKENIAAIQTQEE